MDIKKALYDLSKTKGVSRVAGMADCIYNSHCEKGETTVAIDGLHFRLDLQHTLPKQAVVDFIETLLANRQDAANMVEAYKIARVSAAIIAFALAQGFGAEETAKAAEDWAQTIAEAAKPGAHPRNIRRKQDNAAGASLQTSC